MAYYFRGSMENGFSLNTRLTCSSCPRYHVFRATRITADFTVGSSDMSNTRWKKKLKEGFCEELFPSRSHRKHREQVIETRAKSPYFQSITRTVSFFFLLTRPTPDWRLNPTRTAEQRSFFSVSLETSRMPLTFEWSRTCVSHIVDVILMVLW